MKSSEQSTGSALEIQEAPSRDSREYRIPDKVLKRWAGKPYRCHNCNKRTKEVRGVDFNDEPTPFQICLPCHEKFSGPGGAREIRRFADKMATKHGGKLRRAHKAIFG